MPYWIVFMASMREVLSKATSAKVECFKNFAPDRRKYTEIKCASDSGTRRLSPGCPRPGIQIQQKLNNITWSKGKK